MTRADNTENMNEEMLDEVDDYGIITLTLDDDTELECSILSIYSVEGNDQQYIALLPLNDEGEIAEESEVLIYRFIDNGDDEPTLENIDDDDEFEMAADAFDEILDEQVYDEEDTEEE